MLMTSRLQPDPHRAKTCRPRASGAAGPNCVRSSAKGLRRTEVQCAGLVTDFGSVNEGVPQQAWSALQDARSLGILERIDLIETMDSRDRAANIAAFGDDGYDIIVTVGSSIADETASAARRYPDLYFIGVQQCPADASLANMAILGFHEEQSGFLAGALAALVSQTRRIAAVCEENFVDSDRRYCDGFRAGAEYADSGMDVSVSYRSGSQDLLFHDLEWGRTTGAAKNQPGRRRGLRGRGRDSRRGSACRLGKRRPGDWDGN